MFFSDFYFFPCCLLSFVAKWKTYFIPRRYWLSWTFHKSYFITSKSSKAKNNPRQQQNPTPRLWPGARDGHARETDAESKVGFLRNVQRRRDSPVKRENIIHQMRKVEQTTTNKNSRYIFLLPNRFTSLAHREGIHQYFSGAFEYD